MDINNVNEDKRIEIILSNMHESDKILMEQYKLKILKARNEGNIIAEKIYQSKLEMLFIKYMPIKDIADILKDKIHKYSKINLRESATTSQERYNRRVTIRDRQESKKMCKKMGIYQLGGAGQIEEEGQIGTVYKPGKYQIKINPREKLLKLQQKMVENPPKTTIGKRIAALKLDLITNIIKAKDILNDISQKDAINKEKSFSKYSENKTEIDNKIAELESEKVRLKSEMEALMERYTEVGQQLREAKGNIRDNKEELRKGRTQYIKERVSSKSGATKELMVINKGIMHKIGNFLRKKLNDFRTWRTTKNNQAQEKLEGAITRATNESNKEPKLSERIAATVSEEQAINKLEGNEEQNAPNVEQEHNNVGESEGIEPGDD